MTLLLASPLARPARAQLMPPGPWARHFDFPGFDTELAASFYGVRYGPAAQPYVLFGSDVYVHDVGTWRALPALGNLGARLWSAADGRVVVSTQDFSTFKAELKAWDGAAWTAVGQPANGAVQTLLVDGAGVLYAGGLFTAMSGVPASRSARYDGAWTSPGAVGSGDVASFALAGRDLWMGGAFDVAGGERARAVTFWTGATALATATEPELGDEAASLRLRFAGAHPARGEAAVRVDGTPTGAVLRVTVYDVLGRAVALVHTGAGPDGLVVRFGVGSWAPGLYVVRAEVAGRAASLPLVVR